jgi:uncharacterized protein YcbK (DUF882 family)
LLPILLKIHLATTMAASFAAAASPVPIPAEAAATLFAGELAAPVEVNFYDENDHQAGTVAIWRDGATDEDTTAQIKKLFRCRSTFRQKKIAAKTLAMLADVSEHYPGKVLEYVSGYRVGSGESSTSPHRDGRAIDFRVRGVQLREIRDYLWKTYTEVGVGWYPVEQFVHIDTRPGLHDTAWTFLNGANHYHPYWAELARDPELQARIAQAQQRRHAGS